MTPHSQEVAAQKKEGRRKKKSERKSGNEKKKKKRAEENGASVRLRPAVDCGLGLLLPQHSLPASLGRGDVFSSGNISGSCSGGAEGAPLAALTAVGSGGGA